MRIMHAPIEGTTGRTRDDSALQMGRTNEGVVESTTTTTRGYTGKGMGNGYVCNATTTNGEPPNANR